MRTNTEIDKILKTFNSEWAHSWCQNQECKKNCRGSVNCCCNPQLMARGVPPIEKEEWENWRNTDSLVTTNI